VRIVYKDFTDLLIKRGSGSQRVIQYSIDISYLFSPFLSTFFHIIVTSIVVTKPIVICRVISNYVSLLFFVFKGNNIFFRKYNYIPYRRVEIVDRIGNI